MPANQLTITVSGGNSDENIQLSNVVQTALREHHFTDVHVDAPALHYRGYTLADLARAMHPELRNTPVRIVAVEPEDAVPAGFDFTAGMNIQPVDFRFAM